MGVSTACEWEALAVLLAIVVFAIVGFYYVCRDRRVTDPQLRRGARFRGIRRVWGGEDLGQFCGPGFVDAIEAETIRLRLTGHADRARIGLVCSVRKDDWERLAPLWETTP